MADLSSFSDNEVRVLSDMTEEWIDKDRHGHLASDLAYSPEMIQASDDLYSATAAEWRKRGLYA
ncbi:hypothetical protein [Streptomyces sp. NPDC053048]|uniref:hypothetical protein n=1 Tax=Streptomyces sp. NPDC053048 TaxID=3365694 RepID=UPI0037D52D05